MQNPEVTVETLHGLPRIETLVWKGTAEDGCLIMIDQTRLPGEAVELECRDVNSVWRAIKRLSVRGAPAIGIAAAYGVVLGMQRSGDEVDRDGNSFITRLREVVEQLSTSRPTAVNLFWALERMRQRGELLEGSWAERQEGLLSEALSIHDEDREICRAIGRNGATLVASGDCALTHCNAGGLATSEYGTALSVIFTAQDMGKRVSVYVDETRPLLQGARLTAWELSQRGVDSTLICDSAAAQVMREGKIDVVITGADRIAANGDAANKIGTYSVAVLANFHNIPFYIAAPLSTFDMSLPDGTQIPIEERSSEEVTNGFGRRTAPPGISVYNPAFDVTPAALISGIITEKGIIQPVDRANVAAHFG